MEYQTGTGHLYALQLNEVSPESWEGQHWCITRNNNGELVKVSTLGANGRVQLYTVWVGEKDGLPGISATVWLGQTSKSEASYNRIVDVPTAKRIVRENYLALLPGYVVPVLRDSLEPAAVEMQEQPQLAPVLQVVQPQPAPEPPPGQPAEVQLLPAGPVVTEMTILPGQLYVRTGDGLFFTSKDGSPGFAREANVTHSLITADNDHRLDLLRANRDTLDQLDTANATTRELKELVGRIFSHPQIKRETMLKFITQVLYGDQSMHTFLTELPTGEQVHIAQGLGVLEVHRAKRAIKVSAEKLLPA